MTKKGIKLLFLIFARASYEVGFFEILVARTMALIVIFSQCLYRLSIPAFCPTFVRGKGCTAQRINLHIFELFPVSLVLSLHTFLLAKY